MRTINEALEILEKDKINNINIINFIKNNKVNSIDILGATILCRGESDRKWIYISSKSTDELNKIKEILKPDDTNYAAIEEWMMPILTERKEVIWKLSAVQYYLLDSIYLKSNKKHTIRLKEEDASVVYDNSTYKEYISVKYIKERIQKGISVGLIENNNLVSWAITQDDGAIGFLHTIKDYRRKGYGREVILSITDKLRNIGEIPFAYVEETNNASKNMFLNIGFKENKISYWFQIK